MAEDSRPARRALASFARDYAARKAVLDRAAATLRDERDTAIIEAFSAGMTTREIATVFGEISHQRVAQIVQQR